MVWQPAARPQWVEELNAFGRTLGAPAALVPLDEASLIASAVHAAGGAKDFGDDASWRESFSFFLGALESEAKLNLVGRLMARNEIVRSLRNRLEVVATLKGHPEIASEEIREPVLV